MTATFARGRVRRAQGPFGGTRQIREIFQPAEIKNPQKKYVNVLSYGVLPLGYFAALQIPTTGQKSLKCSSVDRGVLRTLRSHSSRDRLLHSPAVAMSHMSVAVCNKPAGSLSEKYS